MSISVTGYTEAKIEGKWYCIDFFQYDMNGHVHYNGPHVKTSNEELMVNNRS